MTMIYLNRVKKSELICTEGCHKDGEKTQIQQKMVENSHYSLFAAWQPERQIRGGCAFRLRVGEGRKSSHSCHLNFMVTVNLISLGEFSVKMKVKV